MSTYIWTYIYRVGNVEYGYNAPNRKEADKLAKADGVPPTAFLARY